MMTIYLKVYRVTNFVYLLNTQSKFVFSSFIFLNFNDEFETLISDVLKSSHGFAYQIKRQNINTLDNIK